MQGKEEGKARGKMKSKMGTVQAFSRTAPGAPVSGCPTARTADMSALPLLRPGILLESR